MSDAVVLVKILSCLFLIGHAQKMLVNDHDAATTRFQRTIAERDCWRNGRNLTIYKTVEDIELCSLTYLPEYAKKYFQAGAGKQFTLWESKHAYNKYRIVPRVLRDVSKIDLTVTVLGEDITMPIAADPVALQKLASSDGELDTVRAISEAGTIMGLSSLSSTTIEAVAGEGPKAIKWMQVYIFPNKTQTLNLIRRAENAGFKAVVVTVDSPIPGPLPDDARDVFPVNPQNVSTVNLFTHNVTDPSLTFDDLHWLVSKTRLPVVAKGILTARDALEAARVGVKAILVSNHGGRQLDFDPPTIDVLPSIADVLRRNFREVEVYVDGGVRNGFDVFKALSRGARAVFVGRPIIWGLAVGGQAGVTKVLDILRTELKQTMMLAGTANVREIGRDMVVKIT